MGLTGSNIKNGCSKCCSGENSAQKKSDMNGPQGMANEDGTGTAVYESLMDAQSEKDPRKQAQLIAAMSNNGNSKNHPQLNEFDGRGRRVRSNKRRKKKKKRKSRRDSKKMKRKRRKKRKRKMREEVSSEDDDDDESSSSPKEVIASAFTPDDEETQESEDESSGKRDAKSSIKSDEELPQTEETFMNPYNYPWSPETAEGHSIEGLTHTTTGPNTSNHGDSNDMPSQNTPTKIISASIQWMNGYGMPVNAVLNMATNGGGPNTFVPAMETIVDGNDDEDKLKESQDQGGGMDHSDGIKRENNPSMDSMGSTNETGSKSGSSSSSPTSSSGYTDDEEDEKQSTISKESRKVDGTEKSSRRNSSASVKRKKKRKSASKKTLKRPSLSESGKNKILGTSVGYPDMAQVIVQSLNSGSGVHTPVLSVRQGSMDSVGSNPYASVLSPMGPVQHHFGAGGPVPHQMPGTNIFGNNGIPPNNPSLVTTGSDRAMSPSLHALTVPPNHISPRMAQNTHHHHHHPELNFVAHSSGRVGTPPTSVKPAPFMNMHSQMAYPGYSHSSQGTTTTTSAGVPMIRANTHDSLYSNATTSSGVNPQMIEYQREMALFRGSSSKKPMHDTMNMDTDSDFQTSMSDDDDDDDGGNGSSESSSSDSGSDTPPRERPQHTLVHQQSAQKWRGKRLSTLRAKMTAEMNRLEMAEMQSDLNRMKRASGILPGVYAPLTTREVPRARATITAGMMAQSSRNVSAQMPRNRPQWNEMTESTFLFEKDAMEAAMRRLEENASSKKESTGSPSIQSASTLPRIPSHSATPAAEISQSAPPQKNAPIVTSVQSEESPPNEAPPPSIESSAQVVQ